jgi:hypothetical protein
MLTAIRCVAVLVIAHVLAVSTGIAQDLVASYPFDGDANDASGNGNNGRVIGATLTVDRYGTPNKAYSFNGTTDYIEVPHSDALNFDGADFSVSAWIKFRGLQAAPFAGLICKGPAGTSYPGWQFCILEKRLLGEEVTVGAGSSDRMSSDVDVSAIACLGWRHVVLVVRASAGEIRLYVDGALASSKTVGVIRTGLDNTGPCLIGTDHNKTSFFAGAIDDIKIFNRALAPSDIRALYSDGGLWPPDRKPLSVSFTTPVNLGTVSGCASTNDLHRAALSVANNGTEPVTIAGASFHERGLSIAQPLPITFEPGTPVRLEVQWNVQRFGQLIDTVQLQLFPCDSIISVPVTGEKRGSLVVHADSVDFGQLLPCDMPVTSMLPITFTDEAGADGTVTDIVSSPPFTTTVSTIPIASGSTGNLPITFSPTAEGEFVGTLRFTIQPCGLQRVVVLHGVRATPHLRPPPSLMLGGVPVWEALTRTVDFINDGTARLAIDSVIGSTQGIRVKRTVPVLPAGLDPWDTLHVLVEYHPTMGPSRAQLHVISPDLCGADVTTDISGFGDNSGVIISIIIPQYSARVGERFPLSIKALSDVDLDTLGLYNFTAELAFDKTLMLPVDPAGLADSGRLSTLRISGHRAVGSTMLAKIPCVAALGDSDATPIRLLSFAWLDSGAVPVKTLDGSLTIEGICRQGGVRLFNGSVRTAIKSITPNPAEHHLRVSFEVAENGPVHLGLSDGLGSEARVLVEQDLTAGTYEAECDLTGLATGIYWCVLRTAGTHALAPVTIRR